MTGLGLAVLVALAWDVWAEVDHRVKITTAVRSSTAAKTVVLVVGVLLLVHLLAPEDWATKYDPLDRMEHKLHRWTDEP